MTASLYFLVICSAVCIVGRAGAVGVTSATQFINALNSGASDIVIESSFLLRKSVPEIKRNVTIRGNVAKCASQEKGGLCYIHGKYKRRHLTVSGASVSLSHLSLKGGQAARGGSVLLTGGASLKATKVTFSFNYASGAAAAGGGGAIQAAGKSKLAISNCIFIRNSASYGGAIDLTGGTAASISGTRFHNNSAVFAGGAISAFASSTANISSSKFTRSVATKASGVFVRSSSVTLCRNSAYGNKAVLVESPVFLSTTSSKILYCQTSAGDIGSELGGAVAYKCPC